MKAFGGSLEAILVKKGISKAELASMIGVGRSYITNICKGKRKNISASVKEKIAKVLGVILVDTLMEQPEMEVMMEGRGIRLPRMKLSMLNFSEILKVEIGKSSFVLEIDQLPESKRIKEGDLLMIDPVSQWREGSLCVILVMKTKNPVLRRPYQKEKLVRLRSDDSEIADEFYPLSELRVYPVIQRITKDF